MSAPRGRGRGRGKLAKAQEAEPEPEATPSTSRGAPVEDVVMQDAAEGSTSAAAGPAGRKLGTMGGTSARDRPVGGLLGASEYTKKAPSKLKFVPNMKRKARAVVENDDDAMEDVKPDISSLRTAGRGRGRGERKEIEMTASGPMAQGPSGAPVVSSRSGGTRGVAIMNRAPGGSGSSSRPSGGQFDNALDDPDDSDLNEEDEDNYRVRARNLNDIGKEEDMAPLVLPRDPKVLKLAKERKLERAQARLKSEAKPKFDQDTKEFTPITLDSASATPAPQDSASVADTLDSKDSKDLVQALREVEIKPELEVKNDFDLEDSSKEQLYIFQFPRKFPYLVNALNIHSSTIAPDGIEIKPEGGSGIKAEGGEETKPSATRRKEPPEWGRAGPRGNKAARWPMDEGQIGELCIHKSGKVSLLINNDLDYDVLPAAQPTFLQEVVILDHDEANVPRPLGTEGPPSVPNRAVLTMGQTSRKFLVVPDVENLLDSIQDQEKEERSREAKLKALKKEQK